MTNTKSALINTNIVIAITTTKISISASNLKKKNKQTPYRPSRVRTAPNGQTMITCVRCWQTLGCPGWGDTTVPRRTCRWHWRTPCAPWSRSRPETPQPAAPWSPSCRPQTACRTRPLPATPPCSTVWTHTKRQCCLACCKRQHCVCLWVTMRDDTCWGPELEDPAWAGRWACLEYWPGCLQRNTRRQNKTTSCFSLPGLNILE